MQSLCQVRKSAVAKEMSAPADSVPNGYAATACRFAGKALQARKSGCRELARQLQLLSQHE